MDVYICDWDLSGSTGIIVFKTLDLANNYLLDFYTEVKDEYNLHLYPGTYYEASDKKGNYIDVNPYLVREFL